MAGQGAVSVITALAVAGSPFTVVDQNEGWQHGELSCVKYVVTEHNICTRQNKAE